MIDESTAEVIDLNAHRRTHLPEQDTHIWKTRTITLSASEGARSSSTSLADLYPASEAASTSAIGTVRQLLSEAAKSAAGAQASFASGDQIESDQQMMLVQGALQELFLCRGVSEGMGNVVLATYYALKNKRGAPLNLDEVFAVTRALERVRENLFLTFEQSLDVIDALSDSGLVVEPPEAEQLADLLAAEDAA